VWWIVIGATLVNMYIGREFAALGPHMPGARLSRRRTATAFLAFGLEVAFFVWNRTTGTLPFSFSHAVVLAAGTWFGMQQVDTRRRALTKGINVISSRIVAAFAHPFSSSERVRQLVETAAQDPWLEARLSAAARPASEEEHLDLLLRELGSALLARLGHAVLSKESMHALTPRDLAFLERSNARTWALLDPAAFDWPTVNEALYHVSEARLRHGIPEGELTAIERGARAERRARRPAKEPLRRDRASTLNAKTMDSAAAQNVEAFRQAMHLHEAWLTDRVDIDAKATAAVRAYEEALNVCLAEHNLRAAAIVLFYHGRLVEEMGQLSEAEGKLREALGIIESSPNADLSQQKAESACLFRLGVVVGRRGARNEAREFLERALHIDEALIDVQGRSAVLAALDAVFE
jgi:tetratricopeptide (TPR) repeat protein